MGWSLVDVDSDLVGTWPAPKDRVNWDPGPMAKLETHIWKYRWTPFCDHTWYANDIAYIYIFSHTHIYIYIPIVDLQSYCWGTQRASGSQRNSSLKRKFPVPKKHEFFQDDLCLSSKQLWKHWLTFHSWEITKWLYPLNDATNMYIYIYTIETALNSPITYPSPYIPKGLLNIQQPMASQAECNTYNSRRIAGPFYGGFNQSFVELHVIAERFPDQILGGFWVKSVTSSIEKSQEIGSVASWKSTEILIEIHWIYMNPS